MSSNPVISVVVFVLNAVGTIEKALESVTSSGQPPVELLVMDGGSTDGTVGIIRRYESRITFWRSHPDGGAAYALNEGIKRATGDIICLLPADDWVEPGALHLVRDAFANNHGLEVLSCGTRFAHFAPDGSIIVDAEYFERKVLELNMRNLVHCPLTAGRFILRRLYDEIGGFDPNYQMSNDLDFLIKVLTRHPRSEVLQQLVYTYRKHPGSRTLGGNPQMVFEMMRDNIAVAKWHIENSNFGRSDRRELLGLHGRSSGRYAWMHLRGGRFVEFFHVIADAIRLNPLWPMQVVLWGGRKWFREVFL